MKVDIYTYIYIYCIYHIIPHHQLWAQIQVSWSPWSTLDRSQASWRHFFHCGMGFAEVRHILTHHPEAETDMIRYVYLANLFTGMISLTAFLVLFLDKIRNWCFVFGCWDDVEKWNCPKFLRKKKNGCRRFSDEAFLRPRGPSSLCSGGELRNASNKRYCWWDQISKLDFFLRWTRVWTLCELFDVWDLMQCQKRFFLNF